MARVLTKGVVVDTKLLAKDLRSIPALIQQEVQAETIIALQDILKNLRDNTTNRLTESIKSVTKLQANHVAAGHPADTFKPLAPTSGTVDNPFKDARVKHRGTDPKRKGLGDRRLNVYVDMDDGKGNNKFNILDGGQKIRTQKTLAIFPAVVKNDRGFGETATRSMDKYKPETSANYFRQAELDYNTDGTINMIVIPAGYRFKKNTRGRGYYQAVALYVSQVLVGRKIPLPSGEYYKITDEDMINLVIRVSSGNRLTKVK